MKTTVVNLVLLVLLSANVDCGNILVLHPMYAASHILTLRTLAKNLAHQGHKVHIIRWKDRHIYPPLDTDGVTEQVLAVNNSDASIPMFTHEERASFQMPLDIMWAKGTSITAIPIEGFYAVKAFCSSLLRNSLLLEQLASENYDMAIVDLVYNECSLAVAHHLGLPVIGYWAFTFAGGEPQYTTAFNFPSVTPLILSQYTDTMTFSQRLINHLLDISSHLIMQTQFFITGYQIRSYLPSCPWPDVLLGNLSGVLINSHPAVDYPRLLPPSFIEVGGLQIRKDPLPLPQDISAFMDDSNEHGVVLFTMGFIFDFNFVPQRVVKQYMIALGRLKQKVLLKAVGRPPVDVPDNVKIVSWVPQQDVLGHKNLVVFVTHCGMHGVMEALHHGVPMVGIPIFSDQQDVLVRLVQHGVAIGVSKEVDQDVIYQAITEVISNPRYRTNAIRLSKIIHDSWDAPLGKAMWLINHVMNTGGAEHMKLSSRHLNIIQIYGIDIIFCIFIFGFLFIYIIKKRIIMLTNGLFHHCTSTKKLKSQ